MEKKSFALAVLAPLVSSGVLGIFKATIPIFKDLKFAWFVAIFLLVLSMSFNIIFSLKLYQNSALCKKINILGKEYYDIFEDVLFFQKRKPRNEIVIHSLIWDFSFSENEQDAFLDLKAKWKVDFSSKVSKVKQVKIGVNGGCTIVEKEMGISSYQENLEAAHNLESLQDDCSILNIKLPSDVNKDKYSSINLNYNWSKFAVTDRKDDYVYLFPYSHAERIEDFKLITKHPYLCKARVFLLKRTKWGGYDQIEITNSNCLEHKVTLTAIAKGEEHSIKVRGLNHKDVFVVIFERTATSEKG